MALVADHRYAVSSGRGSPFHSLGTNENTRMSLWTLRIGIALTVFGLVLLSPLGDLLPIDFWPSLKSLVAAGPAPAEPVFYRVVPAVQSRVVEFALIGIGLALVGAALFVRLRK